MSECGLCSHGLPMSGGGKHKQMKPPEKKKSMHDTKVITITSKVKTTPVGKGKKQTIVKH